MGKDPQKLESLLNWRKLRNCFCHRICKENVFSFGRTVCWNCEPILNFQLNCHFDISTALEIDENERRKKGNRTSFPLEILPSPTFFDGRFQIATHEIKWGGRSHCRLYWRRRGFGKRLIRIKLHISHCYFHTNIFCNSFFCYTGI